MVWRDLLVFGLARGFIFDLRSFYVDRVVRVLYNINMSNTRNSFHTIDIDTALHALTALTIKFSMIAAIAIF